MVVTGCFPFSTFRSVRRLERLPRSIYGGLSALARDYIHGVTSFQNLAGLLDILFYFVSPSYSLTVELVCRRPLEVSLRKSRRQTLHRLTRIRAKFAARSTTLTAPLLYTRYMGRSSLRSCTPFSILPFRGTPRPRDALAAGAWTQRP